MPIFKRPPEQSYRNWPHQQIHSSKPADTLPPDLLLHSSHGGNFTLKRTCKTSASAYGGAGLLKLKDAKPHSCQTPTMAAVADIANYRRTRPLLVFKLIWQTQKGSEHGHTTHYGRRQQRISTPRARSSGEDASN